MDVATAVAVITLGGMVIGAIVSLVKFYKQPDPLWKEPVDKIEREIESWKLSTQMKISEIDSNIKMLNLDSAKIDEIKQRITTLESSIERETTKLESKIDNLINILIKWNKEDG